jgi:ATP-binding cassette subfamily F protein uup
MPPPTPLLALREARLGFGGAPLLDGVTLGIGRGDSVCLVGRNGSGKSTLLKLLAGLVEPDAGERFVQPGTAVAYLPQEVERRAGETVGAHVAAGLGHGGDPDHHRVAAVLDRLSLDPARPLAELSGGEARRAALGRALVGDPDILLLDEPTNHLDLPTIEWLEGELAAFRGGLLTISHDRAFLRRLTRRILWLDRGRIREREIGFAAFEAWAAEVAEAEDVAAHKLERKIAAETHWLRRGVTARRKRNEGRLRRLVGLRKARAERIAAAGRARLALSAAEAGGELVIEAEGISKSFPGPAGPRPIVAGFSTRILRGDRIGVIGANGAGKTTLLRLLTGELAPDSGRVRLGTGIRPLYFDQQRAALDPAATLWRTLAPGGGDSIDVRGQQRHVVAYLREFLFEDRQALMPVASLSGGERARLLLAHLFAQPSNLLVLDEPTNDLDMETLDLLQEVLDDYDGTLLLVSHDRDFLDRLVTSVIAVEGGGRVAESAGGYADYLRQRPAPPGPAPTPRAATPAAASAAPRAARAPRLGYQEQRELAQLPKRLADLGAEIARLEQRLADPGLYGRDPAGFAATGDRLGAARAELDAAELRWLELEEKREAAAADRPG